MKQVLIVGASGFGREVVEMMRYDPACGKDWQIKGMLDNRAGMMDGTGHGVSVVGDPLSWMPGKDEVFVSAIGNPRDRPTYLQPLLDKGATFMTVMEPRPGHKTAEIGQGCILEFGVKIGANVRIGQFVSILTQAVIGHDARVGDYASIGVMAFMGGGSEVGDYAIVHPHATIVPGIKIGAGATVGAGAVVLKDVPPGATVFGNPAKVIFEP